MSTMLGFRYRNEVNMATQQRWKENSRNTSNRIFTQICTSKMTILNRGNATSTSKN
jgi:hypothetical protein